MKITKLSISCLDLGVDGSSIQRVFKQYVRKESERDIYPMTIEECTWFGYGQQTFVTMTKIWRKTETG